MKKRSSPCELVVGDEDGSGGQWIPGGLSLEARGAGKPLGKSYCPPSTGRGVGTSDRTRTEGSRGAFRRASVAIHLVSWSVGAWNRVVVAVTCSIYHHSALPAYAATRERRSPAIRNGTFRDDHQIVLSNRCVSPKEV